MGMHALKLFNKNGNGAGAECSDGVNGYMSYIASSNRTPKKAKKSTIDFLVSEAIGVNEQY